MKTKMPPSGAAGCVFIKKSDVSALSEIVIKGAMAGYSGIVFPCLWFAFLFIYSIFLFPSYNIYKRIWPFERLNAKNGADRGYVCILGSFRNPTLNKPRSRVVFARLDSLLAGDPDIVREM
ncbi:MAG: hypothetical protein ACLUEQ_11555 [Cloacibacillus evryensis]